MIEMHNAQLISYVTPGEASSASGSDDQRLQTLVFLYQRDALAYEVSFENVSLVICTNKPSLSKAEISTYGWRWFDFP